MLAPQSDEEIRPVVEALRRLDPLLDLVWNPQAVMEAPGAYSVMGNATRPTYAGRWQVIRRDKAASIHDERDYTLVCTVTECDRSGKYPIMIANGAYAPVGDWLVTYMHVWDAAQCAFVDAIEHQWKEHEKLEELKNTSDAHQEAAERMYRRFGGEYWMGGAQGRSAPETARTLFGEPPTAGRSSPPDSQPADISTDTATEGRAQTAAALAASTP